jgi:hypothetical protein
VYEGELVGMILAVYLIKEEGGKGTLALGVDNQAAIKATGAFNSKAGHTSWTSCTTTCGDSST